MNIGIFTDAYMPQVNGVVTVVRVLKTGLEERGHKVYIFTVKHPGAKDDEEGVYRIPSVQFPAEPQHRIGMFLNKQVFDMARPLKLDIIHSHSEFSVYLASRHVSRKFNIPAIHTLHSYYPDYVHYLPPPLKQIMEKKLPAYMRHIFRSQRCVIVPSAKNADYLSMIKYTKPVRVIPNGIDLSHFLNRGEEIKSKGVKMRERLGVAPDEDMIVFVGRLGAEKNIPVLIDNFAELVKRRKAKLVIVGDGPDRRALETHCRENGLGASVVFTGYFSWPDEIKQVYTAGDLFMSASHSEVHPITFIEAMAAGLPVVAAADKSIAGMVINNENGFAVEDDTVMWEKALQILENPKARISMGQKSADLSQNYTLDRFVDRMIACYEEYIK